MMETEQRPSILYVLLSRKFWMSILSMAVAVGVLSFSDAEQAEMVSAIVGGIGAVYTIAVAIEDGMRAKAETAATQTTVSTPGKSDVQVIGDTSSSGVTVTAPSDAVYDRPVIGRMGMK